MAALLSRVNRFEHARIVLLQYQTCNQYNKDGTVDIPISIEVLYGFVVARLFARYPTLWTPRTEIDSRAEAEIAKLRLQAAGALVTQPLPLSLEVSPNMMHSYQTGVYMAGATDTPPLARFELPVAGALPPSLDMGALSARSEADPGSQAECDINSPAGTWEFLPLSTSPSPTGKAKCCAAACSAEIKAMGASPIGVLQSTCCSACNKNSCSSSNTPVAAAVALLTVVTVPSQQTYLNGIVTTVYIAL
jgi:hypothetical protein